MTVLSVKLVFLLVGLYAVSDFEPQMIVMFLIAVTVSAMLQYLNKAAVTAIAIGLYGVVCFFLPMGLYFMPVLALDFVPRKINIPIFVLPLYISWQNGYVTWMAIHMTLAFLCSHLIRQAQVAATAYTTLQDTHTEQSLTLRNKHNELLETQDKIASMATLQERTRIAQDIHDNIGHILVRGILLTGVLKSINKLPELNESITTLELILKDAMDTIRSAVHGWKDEAIDLYGAAQKLSASANLKVDLQYDVSEHVPTNIKLAFLMVVKEALTNAAKHSSAKAIRIAMQEHPALYQLLIKDNGRCAQSGEVHYGMGLANIEERIAALGGTCAFESINGFRIFISIPKLKGESL